MPRLALVYQPELFSDEHGIRVIAALRAVGVEPVPFSYSLSRESDVFSWPDMLDRPDVVGVMGSLRYVRDAGKWCRALPWTTLLDPQLCYYHRYQYQIPPEYNLNAKALMLTFAEMSRRGPVALRQCFDRTGDDGVFIRPDQAMKVCEAEVVSPLTWSSWLDYRCHRSGLTDTSLMWFAPAVSIMQECRCLIGGGKLLSVSSYGININPENMDGHAEITSLVNKVTPHIMLDDHAYALDVALTGQGWKVVELNGLSTSGLYALTPERVAQAWSDALHYAYVRDFE